MAEVEPNTTSRPAKTAQMAAVATVPAIRGRSAPNTIPAPTRSRTSAPIRLRASRKSAPAKATAIGTQKEARGERERDEGSPPVTPFTASRQRRDAGQQDHCREHGRGDLKVGDPRLEDGISGLTVLAK